MLSSDEVSLLPLSRWNRKEEEVIAVPIRDGG